MATKLPAMPAPSADPYRVLLRRKFEERDVRRDRAEDSNHCLHWFDGLPDGARELIDLLGEGLVLPTGDSLLDLALDWYKIVEDGVSSIEWKNSVPGELVRKAKY